MEGRGQEEVETRLTFGAEPSSMQLPSPNQLSHQGNCGSLNQTPSKDAIKSGEAQEKWVRGFSRQMH